MPITLYKQKFRLLDNSGEPYKLRREMITSLVMRYREPTAQGSNQFTENFDCNIDEVNNCVWFNLPPKTLEWYIVITVSPLRTIQTALKTTTFTMGMQEVEVFATPCPLEALQGHSPYIDPNTLTWFQYDDENQCYYDTNIKASGIIDPTQPIDHPIVDYIQTGVMSAVTSNAVANITNEIFVNMSVANQRIDNLENKRVSAILNGETHTENDNGVIDLGNINTDTYKDNLRMVSAETETLPNGQIIPYGSVVEKDTNELFSLSSPNQYFKQSYTSPTWFNIGWLNGNCTIDVRLQIYNNIFGGVIYVERNGYNYKAVTTSQALKNSIKIWQRGLDACLVIQGQMYISMGGNYVVSNGKITVVGSPITSYQFDPTKLVEMDVFMTSYTESADYITIDTNTYNTNFEELNTFNYNLNASGTTNFVFDDETQMPFVLNFYAMHDNTIIKVSDSTNEWVAESANLNEGDLAILTWVDKDNFSWSYSTKREYEVTSNKVTAITETNKTSKTLYPSVGAMVNWVNTAIQEGGKVKDIVLNGDTYEPTDGTIDLGTLVDPLYKLWVSNDWANGAVNVGQLTLTTLNADKTKSLASTNFVIDYFNDNALNEIVLNNQRFIPTTTTPNSIDLGKMSVTTKDGKKYFAYADGEHNIDLSDIGGGGSDLPKELLYKTDNKTIIDGNGIGIAYVESVGGANNFGMFGTMIANQNGNNVNVFGKSVVTNINEHNGESIEHSGSSWTLPNYIQELWFNSTKQTIDANGKVSLTYALPLDVVRKTSGANKVTDGSGNDIAEKTSDGKFKLFGTEIPKGNSVEYTQGFEENDLAIDNVHYGIKNVYYQDKVLRIGDTEYPLDSDFSKVSYNEFTKQLHIDGNVYQLSKASSVKVNDNTYIFDDNGVADLGTIGGAANAITSNTITSIEHTEENDTKSHKHKLTLAPSTHESGTHNVMTTEVYVDGTDKYNQVKFMGDSELNATYQTTTTTDGTKVAQLDMFGGTIIAEGDGTTLKKLGTSVGNITFNNGGGDTIGGYEFEYDATQGSFYNSAKRVIRYYENGSVSKVIRNNVQYVDCGSNDNSAIPSRVVEKLNQGINNTTYNQMISVPNVHFVNALMNENLGSAIGVGGPYDITNRRQKWFISNVRWTYDVSRANIGGIYNIGNNGTTARNIEIYNTTSTKIGAVELQPNETATLISNVDDYYTKVVIVKNGQIVYYYDAGA